MAKDKLQLDYVSDVDKFLSDFKQKHPPTQSEQAEIDKHRPIFEKRDNPDAGAESSEIWSDF